MVNVSRNHRATGEWNGDHDESIPVPVDCAGRVLAARPAALGLCAANTAAHAGGSSCGPDPGIGGIFNTAARPDAGADRALSRSAADAAADGGDLSPTGDRSGAIASRSQ